jgi:ribonuclease R
VRRNARGFGFLLREDEEDLYLSRREMDGVMDGDIVRAIPIPKRGGRLAGRVESIVKRTRSTLPGTYRRSRRGEWVEPDPALFGEVIDLVSGAVRPVDGEIVEVEMIRYPKGNSPAVGRIVEILGAPGELGTLIKTVVRRHGLPRRFGDEALNQANALPDTIAPEEIARREDLRLEEIFTIDGEDARDFDDAVSVQPGADGSLLLRVSIADVGHWVGRDTPLDRAAFERGTSTYFPDRVIPMLPERLSNGIASLVPGEDRLTLTLEASFDADGERLSSRVYESVIRSSGRWTYTGVAKALEGEEVEGISPHRDHVLRMEELMQRLRGRRLARGSIDFDLPEPDIVIDSTGRPEDVLRAERNDAHRLIEEFMIAANEAVADWLAERRRPAVYRVHAPPDPVKMRQFLEFARNYGHVPEFGALPSGVAVSGFLRGIAGQPAERAVNHILLRTMMKAEYAEENLGHYGLASERYLHFTSPIRRYPDLLVHRAVKAALGGDPPPDDAGELASSAAHCTDRETASRRCEYDVLDVIRADFMADRIGESFEGIVSGVIEEGFFVELIDYFVEGMVRVEDLGEPYRFVPESRVLLGRGSRRRFAIGDSIRITVQAVHRESGRIEFAPPLLARSRRRRR